HRAARVIPVAATGAGGRAATRRGDAEDRRVAAIVAQTWVLAGLATQDGRVVAQVVGGRLERNPAVRLLVRRRRWEVGLDPGVGIFAPDHEVVQVLVLLAGTVAADQADRDAEGAEHVAHRGREIYAVALLRFEQEVLDRVSALRRLRRRQRVGEVARVTQVVLVGGRRAFDVVKLARIKQHVLEVPGRLQHRDVDAGDLEFLVLLRVSGDLVLRERLAQADLVRAWITPFTGDGERVVDTPEVTRFAHVVADDGVREDDVPRPLE